MVKLLRTMRDYREAHGDAELARRLAHVAERTAFKWAALSTYYPAVGAAALRWKLRPFETILSVAEGERRFAGGRFAIFLVYQPDRTPWYVRNALRALAEARINVLLVFNHPLDETRLAEFRASCFRLMIRNNAGLDIGGYRDGYLALREAEGLERLLFLNDSVYFFETGLRELLERLVSSKADVTAAYENRQFHYHLQSFCLALSREMVGHEAVRRFFAGYVPINSRRWAIHRGEVGLSEALVQAARTIEVVYRLEDLETREEALPRAFVANPSDFLPIVLRRRYDWMRRQAPAADETPLETYVRLVAGQSQIHAAGFLFRARLGSPLMKRDLVFRQVYSPDEVRNLLGIVGDEGHAEEIVADLTRKGIGGELRGLQLGRYAAGMI